MLSQKSYTRLTNQIEFVVERYSQQTILTETGLKQYTAMVMLDLNSIISDSLYNEDFQCGVFYWQAVAQVNRVHSDFRNQLMESKLRQYKREYPGVAENILAQYAKEGGDFTPVRLAWLKLNGKQ